MKSEMQSRSRKWNNTKMSLFFLAPAMGAVVAAPLATAATTVTTRTTTSVSTTQRATPTSSRVTSNKPLAFDIIPARGGNIRITPLIHASIQIEYGGKVIIVDPISAGSYRKKADIVLITHPHGDHLDKMAIVKVFRGGGSIVLPYLLNPNATSRLHTRAEHQSLEKFQKDLKALSPNAVGSYAYLTPGSTWSLTGKSISVEAVAMYNLVRGPNSERKYHPKANQWNGYVLTLGGKRIYIAGDTEATPEMKRLRNIDAAFLPMNLPYTMTPQEAAAGARAFKPKVVYPYHFRFPFDKPNNNPQQFANAVRGSGIQVRVLDWYPQAAVARFMAASKS
jgi:L-ascorbate metabolism protein UlaG (beta-lactamase superfamily)